MASPRQALEQLLSPGHAASLDAAGQDAWRSAGAILQSLFGQAPRPGEVSARLAMPDELANEFPDQHLVIPVELSTSGDQTATSYMVLATSISAMFFDTRADNSDDEEQQTLVMVSTVAGQVVQAVNAILDSSPDGLVLSLGDIVADQMPAILADLEDACLYLSVAVQGGRLLPVSFVLTGEFLELLANSYTPAGQTGASSSTGDNAAPADEHAGAQLLDDVPTPPRQREAQSTGETSQQSGPTPISTAPTAQRAHFGPLTEPASTGARSNMDLLSDLQMRVSVELGRTDMSVADVLDLGAGSVIELERLAGEPVDILVNNRIIARGEVVVVDENFGVRIVEVLPRSREIGRVS